MADQRTTDLDPIATILDSAVFDVVDTTNTTQDPAGSSFKITKANLLKEVTAAILLNTAKVGYTEDLVNANATVVASAASLLLKTDKGAFTGTSKDLENLIVAASTGASGISIVPTSPAPTGTGIASFTATQAGTYSNYGGVVVAANSFAIISRSATGAFSISQTAFDLTTYAKIADSLQKTALEYEVGKNKYNKISVSLGGQTDTTRSINNLGVIGNNSGFIGAEIPVLPSTTYAFKHNDNLYDEGQVGRLAYLDINKAIISTVNMSTFPQAGGLGGRLVTTPANCYYIFKNVKVNTKDYLNDFQIEVGNLTTVLEAYTLTLIKILNSQIKDVSARTSSATNTNDISAINNNLKANPNYTVLGKGNTVNTTLVQVDLVFDLNGISFVAGDLVTVNFNLNSTDANLGSALQCRIFQNDVATAPATTGTQIAPFSIGAYYSPSSEITFSKATAINTTRYLHVFLETTLIVAAQLTTFIYKNPNITLKGINKLPVAFGIFNKNTTDSITYKPFLNSDFIKFTDLTDALSNYVPTNNLTSKKLVVIGDSMVKGHTLPSNEVWDSLIVVRNSMTSVNYGINGIQLTNNNSFGNSVLNGYSAMVNDADYVGVFAGTNDDAASVTIGLDTDSFGAGQLTFKGALNDLCKGLITKYSTKKIFFITPYNRQTSTQSYITAILTICKAHSIPVFDNWTNGGILWTSIAQQTSLRLADNYHLNAAGMVYAASKYEAFLKTL